METYIFGLDGDIYGKNIEVQLLAFDRPEQKFTSLEELKERIEKDKEFANAYYENHPEMIAQGETGDASCQIDSRQIYFFALYNPTHLCYTKSV